MIVVDTSALVAIAFDEPECGRFQAVIRDSDRAFVSAVSVVEAKIVVHGRKGQRVALMVDQLLRMRPIEIVSPGSEETAEAYAAFVIYGKRSGHPAALNFGDLFSYALAKVRGVPLLYKGRDFARTDIASALSARGPSI